MTGLHASITSPERATSDTVGSVLHVAGLRPFERAHLLRMALHDGDHETAVALLVWSRSDYWPAQSWTAYVETVICVSRQYAHRLIAKVSCEAGRESATTLMAADSAQALPPDHQVRAGYRADSHADDPVNAARVIPLPHPCEGVTRRLRGL